MSKENTMFGIIGLLLGVVVAGFVAGQAVNNNNTGMMRMIGIDNDNSQQQTTTDHSNMSMVEMNEELELLTGDEFDKAFTEMMIAHHVGAVDMAKLVPARANHDEVKQLGLEIITAQTKEIAEMKQWQKDWGYSDSQMMHEGH